MNKTLNKKMDSHTRWNDKGQALIEFVILVPMLVFFIMFSFQVFKTIYEASVRQEQAKAALIQQLNHRANGAYELSIKRELAKNPQNQDFSAQRIDTRGIPFLSTEGQDQTPIPQRLGICRTMACE